MSSWRTKSSKIVYENPWIFVREDEVITPEGKDGIYGVVESKSDSVFIIPIDDEGNTYIIQQEHYTTQVLEWQCPAGRTDGEPIEVAARRELLEETGLRAKSITVLLEASTASGTTTYQSAICLAQDLQEDWSEFDKGEISAVKKIPLTEAREMILRGEIRPTESIAAYLLAYAYLEKEKTVQ